MPRRVEPKKIVLVQILFNIGMEICVCLPIYIYIYCSSAAFRINILTHHFHNASAATLFFYKEHTQTYVHSYSHIISNIFYTHMHNLRYFKFVRRRTQLLRIKGRFASLRDLNMVQNVCACQVRFWVRYGIYMRCGRSDVCLLMCGEYVWYVLDLECGIKLKRRAGMEREEGDWWFSYRKPRRKCIQVGKPVNTR